MSAFAWLVVMVPTLLTLVFSVEVIAGLRAPRRSSLVGTPRGKRVAIVVPAHDEGASIGATVARLRAEAPPSTRILVVADNCLDDTAAIAAGAGAEVSRRDEPARRGKGYALARARDVLAPSPPDVVIVIDADCSIDGDSIAALVRSVEAYARPAQAVNLLRPTPANASPMVQVSTFAFLIKNLIRQRGLARLSGRVHLTGTGMAMPWSIFSAAPLATADIVEDLSLGLTLARQGDYPMLIDAATVWSEPATAGGTLRQRRRWEGGFLATSLRLGLPTLARAVAAWSAQDLWAALSLLVPPLALLVLLDLAVIATAASLVLGGASTAPALAASAAMLLAVVALSAAWLRWGRAFLSPRAAIRAPLYLAWKLPLYARLLLRRPTGWIVVA